MMRKVSQVVLQTAAKVRRVAITGHREMLLQKLDTILEAIFLAARHFCNLPHKVFNVLLRQFPAAAQ